MRTISIKLNSKQLSITNKLDGSALVIAVPGSGKTTILLERMKNLIDSGVDPDKILTISFSRAAANELKDRFKARYGLRDSPDFHTIHAFAFMILRDYERKHNLRYQLLEGHPRMSKYRILSEINYIINKEYLSEEQLDTLINDIGYVKNMMLRPDSKSFEPSVANFKDIFLKYQEYKDDQGLIDFDDMLTLGLNILNNDKYLRDKYKYKYDYIQVDEGQDTSKIQMEIIKILTQSRNNLFLVADDDQSIYSFRGADPKGILNINKDYPKMETYYMETNYRSTKNIVLTSNQFIKNNKTRFDKELVSNKDFSKPVDVVKVPTAEDQYKHILDETINIDDTGILYRNNISAMGLIEYFERHDIPFRTADNSKLRFYNNRVVSDIVNILAFADDMSNLKALSEIFYKLNGYISRAQINYLSSKTYSTNLLDEILGMPGCPKYYHDSLGLLNRQFKVLNSLKFEEKIQYIGHEMGYIDYLDRSSKRLSVGIQNQKLLLYNLVQISKITSSLDLFIGRLKYLDDYMRRSKNNSNGFNLSTIHSSKGQEYPQVYIIDCYEGVFPNIKKDDPIEIEEEERRLFYVGMTRAMEDLTILYPDKVMGDKTDESRFITDLRNI